MVQKAYETLSDASKRDAYDEQQGLGAAGRGQFNRGMAKARAAAYSDDEYEDMTKHQRRRGPRRSGDGNYDRRWEDDGSHFAGMGQRDDKAWKDFFEESDERGRTHGRDTSRRQRTVYEGDGDYETKFFDDFDDFFNFNDNSYDATRDDTKGADYKADLEVSFLDSINGCETPIHLNKRVVCSACKGRRADLTSETRPRRCFECGGRGTVIGNYGIRKKCPKCEGSGCTSKTRC